MADEGRTAKTETIGHIPLKAIKLDGWKEYHEKAEAFSKAKTAAQTAKESMRETLKAKLVAQKKIEAEDEIDFTVDTKQLTVYKVLAKKEGRKRGTELSL